MRTLLTFDYEVFFGRATGSVARTLLEPTQALCELALRHGVRMVFFVDAGFILRLRAEMHKVARLREEFDAVCRQVEALARAGHEVQLHIHSHWEDSVWTDDGWQVDTRRYRLHDFEPEAIDSIVRRYTTVLRELAGPDHAFAFRAGGWVIQPFDKLHDALRGVGVRIDSTVFAGGVSDGPTHTYDFRAAPPQSHWHFETDPLRPVADGWFLEVPIASHTVSPLFFWRFAVARKLGGAQHRAFGDGRAIGMGRGDMLRKLLRPSVSVVSMDGYKAGFLAQAAKRYRNRGMTDFVVIGHPKALTPYSMSRLDRFLAQGAASEVTTFATYLLPQQREPEVPTDEPVNSAA